MPQEKNILPEKYYLEYFNQVIDFVQLHSGHLLDVGDHEFITTFYSLPEDCQLLFLRLFNRKGPYFRPNKINYNEIVHIEVAWGVLQNLGWVVEVESPQPEHLSLFTLPEWKSWLPNLPVSIKKSGLKEWINEHNIVNELKWPEKVVQFNPPPQVHFLKFLFFGNLHTPMTEFVIRDIGHIALPTPEQTKFKAWYESLDEAKYGFFLYSFYPLIKQMLEETSAFETSIWLEGVDWYRNTESEKNLHIQSKICFRVAHALEKEKEYNTALAYYMLCKTIPTTEKQIRLLEKMDRSHEAISLAEECLSNASNASEWQFLSDFLKRKAKRILRSTTEKLKTAESISIPFQSTIKVEEQALTYYLSLGYKGKHVENQIWKNLFGLVFWDVVFAESSEQFHHPLQRMPSDLFRPNFLTNRQNNIDQLFEKIDKVGIDNHLQKIYDTHYGKTNPFVTWHEQNLETLRILIKFVKHTALYNVLKEMAKNLKSNSTGFPDLFIWNDSTYSFIEIKSPNDHLSPQQLFWLDFLQKNGIAASVVRLNYK